jgi:hypothetical protein
MGNFSCFVMWNSCPKFARTFPLHLNLYGLQPISFPCCTITIFCLNWYSRGWSQLSPLGTAATNRPIVPVPGDYDDGEFGGMTGRENRSTRRKPAPVLLCPPQTGGKSETNRLSYGTAFLHYYEAACMRASRHIAPSLSQLISLNMIGMNSEFYLRFSQRWP